MKKLFDRMTRRSFLAVSAVAPLSALSTRHGITPHHFRYDHVIGTSMDLAIWTPESASGVNVAEGARNAILAEIARLSAVLNTRNPESEISRFRERSGLAISSDLRNIFEIYDRWERLTGRVLSIRPSGPGSKLNVDALGKAYIIDCAAKAASQAESGIDGLLLNIGGDIVSRGRAQEIAIADPRSPYDNAEPMTKVRLRNRAIATSGSYARGNHLVDARSGLPVETGVSSTVIADDAVTANALATALCITTPDEGFRLVQSTSGAEALRLDASGFSWRTPGFARMEVPVVRPISLRAGGPADWPSGFEMSIALTVKEGQPAGGRGGRGGFGGPFGGRGGLKRPYVAVWVENAAGKLVRVLAFWADKPRYYSELSSFFNATGRDQNVLYSIARATRPPGGYQLLWDGLDDQRKPVPVGSYRIVVETNQEHGTYGKQSGNIDCGDAPSMLSLPATANFDPVVIQYGPKQNRP
jgi:thiamine biosynthesis lipoprotein ApbE